MTPTNDNRPVTGAAQELDPSGRACPLCGKPALKLYRPFCSKRCADLDLSRWLNGVYAVPARETDEDEDDGR
ncbi:DNA gyrase inhibitor YacG [Alsobacter sp. R-9]